MGSLPLWQNLHPVSGVLTSLSGELSLVFLKEAAFYLARWFGIHVLPALVTSRVTATVDSQISLFICFTSVPQLHCPATEKRGSVYPVGQFEAQDRISGFVERSVLTAAVCFLV